MCRELESSKMNVTRSLNVSNCSEDSKQLQVLLKSISNGNSEVVIVKRAEVL